MVAFLLEHRQTIGIGLLAVWALMQFGGSFGGFVARLRSMVPGVVPVIPGPGPAPVVDDDAADFQALARLRKRFERNKCKDGQNAVDVCLTHFFHKDG